MPRGSPPEPVVLMKSIVKRYPGVLANDHVDFEVLPGEIHGLLGENGAGKTTLMSILFGTIKPDEGEIYLRGRRVTGSWTPRRALRAGIVMVAQHFKLIPKMTVLENIELGLGGAGVKLGRKELLEKIEEIKKEYGLSVDPHSYVWQLSAGEKQRVELVRAILLDAKLLILDEPTTVLARSEVKGLFKVLELMRRKGRSIVFITHKLWEALEICDRITVLRKGKKVGTISRDKASPEVLTEMMFGKTASIEVKMPSLPQPGDGRVLAVRDLWVRGDRGHWAVKGASFDLSPGEVLGIAGVAGNGQRELVEAIVGLRKPSRGRIWVNSVETTGKSPRELIKLGVAYIPEERIGAGVAPGLSVAENLVSKSYWRKPFSGKLFVNWREIKRYAEELVGKYSIKVSSISVPVESLSGGNIQRVVLARELSLSPKLLIAHNPTMGLDMRATAFIRREILELARRGAAVLLVSEELEEILELSTKVAVMYEGRLCGPFPRNTVTIDDVNHMMISGEVPRELPIPSR